MRKRNNKPDFTSIDWRLEKDRAWYLAVYDLQGGPIHAKAIQELQDFAEQIAEQYNLAINTKVE
jgi:hypothetical protein